MSFAPCSSDYYVQLYVLLCLAEPLFFETLFDKTICSQVRLLEVALVKQWSKKGLMPISHKLLSDPAKCVKDVPV